MLQLLVCSDIHTYADNIRLAIEKTDHVDAILIAGDLELEEDKILAAVGDLPCWIICGNNDYYLNTDYPEELLIDIKIDPDCASGNPVIERVTELTYNSVPESDKGTASQPDWSPASLLSWLFPSKKTNAAKGPSVPLHIVKRPANIAHRILMTHGKEYQVPDITLLTRRAKIWNADIVIFGHTHKFWDTTSQRGKIRLINPGCLIGDPKDSVRSYGRYEICSYALLRIGDRGEIDVEHLYL